MKLIKMKQNRTNATERITSAWLIQEPAISPSNYKKSKYWKNCSNWEILLTTSTTKVRYLLCQKKWSKPCTLIGRLALSFLSFINTRTRFSTTVRRACSFKLQVAWIGKMRWHHLHYWKEKVFHQFKAAGSLSSKTKTTVTDPLEWLRDWNFEQGLKKSRASFLFFFKQWSE